ncbi:MAG: DUF3108 domain-containing protein [Candidatus Marinimicrobia bacterium]|nr:DUF3108 domain-containing protein [Candidatus Neomarinimicrobiota bacterium]
MRIAPYLAILIAATVLAGQDHPFSNAEKLTYEAGFRLLSVGTTTMQVEETDSTEAAAIVIRSKVLTYPIYDRLYKIDDHVVVQLDARTLQLQYLWRNINEGRYHRLDSSLVVASDSLIYTRKDTLAYLPPLYDPIGTIYYLRTQPLKTGTRFQLTIFDGRRLRPIAVEVQKVEKITVPAGEFECYRLVPAPLDDQPMTKVRGFLQLWLSTDEARIPVRIEQQTNFGTMVLKLSGWQN